MERSTAVSVAHKFNMDFPQRSMVDPTSQQVGKLCRCSCHLAPCLNLSGRIGGTLGALCLATEEVRTAGNAISGAQINQI